VTGPAGPFPGNRPAPVTAWLVRASTSRGVSLGLVAAIALTDHFVQWHRMSFPARGLVDEPCHFATAMVVLGALCRWRGHPPSTAFVRAMLICSVAIDLDHLPLEFGSPVLTAGTPRPYTHALWVIVLAAAIALAAGHRARTAGRGARPATVSAAAAGAAWGLAAHFLRDVATAPISLWWPVTDAAVEVPYAWYLVALLILAVLPMRRATASQRP
jgi:inner membrane protein